MKPMKKAFNRVFKEKNEPKSSNSDIVPSNGDEADLLTPSDSEGPIASSKSIQRLFPTNKFSGLRELHAPADAVVDIVFLHGLTGRADTTFLHKKTDTYWPIDLLTKDIPSARILTFGYDANVARFFESAGQNTLLNHASNLVNDLASKRSDNASRSRKIVFVAHSLGGLVAKRAMDVSKNSADEHLKQIERDTIAMAFLGTPHRGAGIAPFANAVAKIVKTSRKNINIDILEPLQRNSQVLAGVEHSFSNWIRDNQDRFQLTCFFEELALPGVGIVVKPESAIIGGWPSRSIPANHMDMTKFSSSDDDGYDRVIGELRRWTATLSAPTVSPIDHRRDVEGALLVHINRVGLQPNDVLYDFEGTNPIEKIHQPVADASLEWFTKSPEFRTWREHDQSTSLWLNSSPAQGKTFVMHYLSQHHRRYFAYDCDIVALRCSKNHSEIILLVSSILQLTKNRLRAYRAWGIIMSWNTSMSASELAKQLWLLLAAMVKDVPDHESIFLIDEIDVLEPDVRASFLNNFLKLQQKVDHSTKTRVLISSRPYPDIKEALTHYQNIEPGKERKECLRTLFFQEWNARETRIDSFYGGSWIPTHKGYQNWMTNPSSDLLWIEGKPGSGKSTLSKGVVRDLREKFGIVPQGIQDNGNDDQDQREDRDQSTIVAEFYYSFRGGITETSHEFMLRSIVYQIWKQNTRLYPLIRGLYRRLRSIKESNIRKNWSWSYQDLKSALQSLHQIDFSLVIFIAIDGLDESDNAKRTEILQLLKNISSQTGQCVMKVMVASRPETDINLQIGGARHIILQEVNRPDIEKWVDKRIGELQGPSGQSKCKKVLSSSSSHRLNMFSGIRDYIVQNSQGVFIWVSLVLNDVERFVQKGAYTIAMLEKRVRGLPKELGGPDGFYQEIVQTLVRHVKEQDQSEEQQGEELATARRILMWVTFPKRPILLHELEDVLATPLQMDNLDLSGFKIDQSRPLELEQGLLSYCGGLVEVRETQSGFIVQLIHQTVREFLLDRNHLACPYDLEEVVFMTAILQRDADESFSEIDGVISHLSEGNLLAYSLKYLTKHLDYLGSSGKDLLRDFEGSLRILVCRPGSYASLLLSKWIQLSCRHSIASIGLKVSNARMFLQSALGWAAGAGRDQVVEILLVLLADVNSKDQDGTYPIERAAKQRHLSTVLLLCERGADVNVQGGYYGNALQAASHRGHDRIVQTLLDYGADVNAQGGKYGNALQAASYSGYDRTTEILLIKGADVNIQDEKHGNALQAASHRGHDRIVQTLLDYGADVNAQGGKHGNALQAASYRGHDKIVHMLLYRGADVNAQGGKHGNALRAASHRGHDKIMQILLDNGAITDC